MMDDIYKQYSQLELEYDKLKDRCKRLQSENEKLTRVAKHGRRVIDETKRCRVGIMGDHPVYCDVSFSKLRIDKYSEEIDNVLGRLING